MNDSVVVKRVEFVGVKGSCRVSSGARGLRAWWPALSWVMLLACATALNACASSRSYLKPSEVAMMSRQKGWKHQIKVYPDAEHLVVFPSGDRRLRVRDDDKFIERHRDQVYVMRVRKDFPGTIVDALTIRGKLWLWVSYSSACRRRSCAFGFVESERGRFSLAHVPRAHGYLPATVYRGDLEDETRMELSRLLSFDEANEIWYWRGEDSVASVDLQVDRDARPVPRSEARR